MRKILPYMKGAAVLAVAVWLWTVLFPGPEKIIRKQLEGVARSASFVANEGALARAANAAKFAGYFSPDVEVSFAVPDRGTTTLNGRKEVLDAAILAREAVNALSVEFRDVSVTLSPDKQSAVVDLIARARVPGDRDYAVQAMKFALKKIGRQWLIIQVETVKSLTTRSAPMGSPARIGMAGAPRLGMELIRNATA